MVAAGSIGSGIATFLHAIPDDVGKISSLTGIILCIFMVQNYRKNNEKADIEIAILKETHRIQLQNAEKHRRDGDPKVEIS